MSQSSIYYHLRPNKAIDRFLFIDLLMRLNRVCSIPSYRYVGFGSWAFDDFKLIHRQLGINDMVSLEADSSVYKRQLFNCPFECINPLEMTSNRYISEFEANKPTIFWLDYADPNNLRGQIDEFCLLIGKLNTKDIIKITLNAHPSNLGGDKKERNVEVFHQQRLESLLKQIGDYLPAQTDYSSIEYDKYPQTLLYALKNAIYRYYPSGQRKKLLPLTSFEYADGQQMLTFTGIVTENNTQQTKEILEALNGWDFINNSWGLCHRIAIPPLTAKERIYLNACLPGKELQEICTIFNYSFDGTSDPKEAIDNYKKYYRYYPNYHQVIF